ncbi:exo-alpha-sialidase [Paenibacillus sp. V4I7]|uniref:exo-alpha-sialidase n=1 Tax=Paenibacillus sp. V4I7 TaxID=3042307 RepID=UPI0027802A97|nr:exo-alpha-sialidase [Paenibacillus sp. V4I7]MDQ0898964.1 sialidase-1 [Paenibacillus sp. V4I7]
MLRKSYLFVFILVFALVQIPLSLIGESQVAEASPAKDPYFQNMDLYVAGTEGYNTFRIPSLLTTQTGTLLAFAEGRKNSAADNGNIDLVLKRSFDQGRTWLPLQIICDAGVDTCGNPTPVQDESTGRIWLFVTQNYAPDTYGTIVNGTSRGVRTIWSTYSDDDGATWTQPVNRFSEVQAPNTRWDGTGPGIGIQLQQGAAKGRLVIPAIDRNIQSDDHGVTWYESGKLPPGLGEPTVVELTDGTLMRNDRLSSHQEIRRRGISISPDQGATWSPIYYDDSLIDPICEASIIRYMPADNGVGNRMLLFANPADTVSRDKMTVRISNDDGQTWSTSKMAYKGPSAYSSLAILPDGKVSLLFEGGEYTPYDKIMFATFNLEWFQVEEPDLDNLLFSDGSLTPVFRGDISEYSLALYSGTEQLTLTPVTSGTNIDITVNGNPVAAGQPVSILLGDLQAISIEAKLGQRVRQYTLHLDRTRPTPDPLVHWDFDQTDANGIVDLTGKGHSGVMHNGAELRPGLDGNALYLNGTRANVEITNEEDLHPGTDDFTFSVWVNPEALFQPMHVLYWYGKAGSKVPQWWFAVHNTGAVRMNMAGLPSGREVGIATAAGLVKTGVWTNITVVRDGSVNKIYVNGEWAATSAKYDSPTMNVTNPSAPPLVGYDKGTVANRDWKGYMDELKIYKYAMNEADVRKHYWHIDKLKPVTQAAVEPGEPNGTNGWYTTDATVTLSVYDDFSGVARTEYRLNSGDWKAYEGAFTVSEEGTQLLEYRSVDRAGNIEDSKSMTLRIDKIAPRLNMVLDKTELWPPNGELVPIQVDIQAIDERSGVAEIKLVSITSNETDDKKGKLDQESDIQNVEYGTDDRTFLLRAERNGNGTGRIYTIEYTVTDQAGHVTSKTAVVSVKHDQSY